MILFEIKIKVNFNGKGYTSFLLVLLLEIIFRFI